MIKQRTLAHLIVASVMQQTLTFAADLQPLKYNNPGLVVDLAVGLWAWPLPMDYDFDGDMDLVVSCPDVPYNGTYLFENPGPGSAREIMPVFKPAIRIGRGLQNLQVSLVKGRPRVLEPGKEYTSFRERQLSNPQDLGIRPDFHEGKVRANQWKYADYDGDGLQDLIIGIEDWQDYGWDNAFNERGEWTNGPLHGYVYWAKNVGTQASPKYAKPTKIVVEGKAADVYGMPSPNLEDFDQDGDLDLLCGEFVDKFTYFENIGNRIKPKYKAGRILLQGENPLRVDLCMMVSVAVDWDNDGHIDLVVGQEDGRVMLIRHTGEIKDGMPQFDQPRYFQQQADNLKFGALATPVGVDWDKDGDEDLIVGNTAGEIGFIENLDGQCPPRWAAPVLLSADGEVIRIQAGSNGSIQGPCEEKWGYTTLSVADWNNDGLLDLIVNSILGKVTWYENVGSPRNPRLAAEQSIEVEWIGKNPKPAWVWWNPKGKELVTQWRTTPGVLDLNNDGLMDLVMLDQEGYLCWLERIKLDDKLLLQPPKRVFLDESGRPFRLTEGVAGASGRRKLHFEDWDGDGSKDLLVNSENIKFLNMTGWHDGVLHLKAIGNVVQKRLAGHDTSPTTVDWNADGHRDLLIGAEDGHFYYVPNPLSVSKTSSAVRSRSRKDLD